MLFFGSGPSVNQSASNMNRYPVNRNISDSLEVQSKISEEISLYIAVCLEWDFGNGVELCDGKPFVHTIQ